MGRISKRAVCCFENSGRVQYELDSTEDLY